MAIGNIADREQGSSVRAKLNLTIDDVNNSVIGVDVQAFDADIPTVVVSQSEAETGTSTSNRTWTPQRVRQAIEAKQFTATVVKTLTGGAATETVDLAIPATKFPAKASVATLTESSGSQGIVARYEFDDASTTSTNARFTIFRTDGANIVAEGIRFGFISFE